MGVQELAAIMQVGSAGLQIGSGLAAEKTARQERRQLEEIGALEASEIRRQGAKRRGAQRVAQAASGIEVGTGTPLAVLAETAEDVELSALRREFGFTEQGRRIQDVGTIAKRQALVGGIGKILGGFLPQEATGGFGSSVFGRATGGSKGKSPPLRRTPAGTVIT